MRHATRSCLAAHGGAARDSLSSQRPIVTSARDRVEDISGGLLAACCREPATHSFRVHLRPAFSSSSLAQASACLLEELLHPVLPVDHIFSAAGLWDVSPRCHAKQEANFEVLRKATSLYRVVSGTVRVGPTLHYVGIRDNVLKNSLFCKPFTNPTVLTGDSLSRHITLPLFPSLMVKFPSRPIY